MTSTEFAAKYRLLKNVATRGARSFLAQQVQLGRMVMVHYLDAENAEERATTVARLNALPSGSRGKLMEIAEVDGTPVAVTLFISSFKDFATWLDSVSPPPAAPPTAPAVTPQAPKKTPGEFTRIFGKVDDSTVAPTTLPPIAMGVTPARNEDAIPTVIMEAVKPPHAAPPPKPEPPPAADSGSSFTAIFGSLGDSPRAPSDLAGPSPLSLPPAASAPLMPPAPPPLDLRPRSPSPAPQAPAPSEPGEFTQLFQRLSPSGGVQPPSPLAGAPSFFAPDVARHIEPAPRADAAPASVPSLGAASLGLPPLAAPALGVPTLGAPSLGIPSLGAPPLSAPKAPESAPQRDVNGLPPMASLTPPPLASAAALPRSWGTPATPPPIGASVFGNNGPSEFTRILSPIAPPPAPPVSIQPPAAVAAASAAGTGKKSMLPLIIALAAVVVITIVIVGYFVMRGTKG